MNAMDKNYRAELVGVFGDPVEGNPTGVMEEAGFEHEGLNYRYLTIKVLPEDLDAAMAGLKAFNMRGINLTMPHKINVLKHMDELSEAARIIGAVNTVVRREDGTLFGENTDGKGFVQSLKEAGVTIAGASICLLGAGGAARSIGVECALAGAAKITVINRNRDRGEDLARIIRNRTDDVRFSYHLTGLRPHQPCDLKFPLVNLAHGCMGGRQLTLCPLKGFVAIIVIIPAVKGLRISGKRIVVSVLVYDLGIDFINLSAHRITSHT